MESWEPSQHLLIDTGKPRKTCVEVAGRRTFNDMLGFLRCEIRPSHIIVHLNTKRLKITPHMGFAPAAGPQPYTFPDSKTECKIGVFLYLVILVLVFFVVWGRRCKFLHMAQQPPVGQGFVIIDASRSHSDTPHSLGVLWTRDQPYAKTSTTTLTADGIRTRNPSKRAAADPRLRPRGHWDRRRGACVESGDR